MPRFLSRRRDGSVRNRLGAAEAAVIASALEGLRALLLEGDDEVLVRLRPPAYPDDEVHERQYQEVVADDLLRMRLDRLDVVQASLGKERVDDDELAAWMTTLNELRLVLGTRLDVTEDHHEVPDDHPDAPAWALYHFLSALLWEVVETLEDTLPPEIR